MKRTPSNQDREAWASLRALLVLSSLFLAPLLAVAIAPQWWTDRAVLTPNATANDYAPANQGQVKNFALQAYAELQAQLPGSAWTNAAGTNLAALIAGLGTNQNANYAPVNIGQLKNLAKPFYDQLIAIGYATNYPWSTSTNTPSDYAIANIGQVKNLFSFDPFTFIPPPATDVTTSADSGGPGFDVTWSGGGAGVSNWAIYRANPGDTGWQLSAIVAGNIFSYYDPTGTGNSIYEVVPYGANGSGPGAVSPTPPGWGGGGGAPAQPPPATPPNPNPPPLTSPRYAVIDLGAGTSTSGINSAGAVLMYTNGVSAVWEQGHTTLLQGGLALSINDAGALFGSVLTPDYNNMAVYWPDKTSAPEMMGFDPLSASYTEGWAWGMINGHVAGYLLYTAGYGPSEIVSFNGGSSYTALYGNAYDTARQGQFGENLKTWLTCIAGSHWVGGWLKMSDIYYLDPYIISSGPLLDGVQYPSSKGSFKAVSTNGIAVGQDASGVNAIYFSGGTSTVLGHGSAAAINGLASPQIVGGDNSGNPTLWDQTSLSGALTNTYIAKNLNHYLSPTNQWNLAAVVGINNDGAIVGTATKTADSSNHGVLLLPIVISQINYPVPSTTNSTMDSGSPTTTKIINSSDANGIALITGAAIMPQLTAKINGLDSSGMTVDWSLTVTSERAQRGTQDNISIPAAGGSSSVINVPINQAWNIASSYPTAPHEIFGGKVTISYQIKKADGTYLMGTPQTMIFKIRGLNPTPTQAHAYIQAEPAAVSTFYYAWGVAKHESAQDQYSAIYCQFNAGGSSAELPNFGAPNGWGVFQRDDTGGGIAVTTDQVYSWKVNSDVAVQQELLQKWNGVNTYLGNLQSSYPTQYAQDPPPTYTTGNGTVFSAVDTLTMETYNGAGTFTSLLKFTPTNPTGSRWVWGGAGHLPNAPNDTKPYVDRVAERMSTSP